jgi:predicted hydrocarbon binding protein
VENIFLSAITNVIKIEDKKERLEQIKELEDYIFETKNTYLALRLAYELEFIGVRTTRIENYICKTGNGRLIYRFASNIGKANIKKLQDAIIKSNDYEEMARFACFVNGADKNKIGDIVAQSNNIKAKYLYMCFIKTYPYNNFRESVLKSKRPRYLFQYAKLSKDEKDLEIIQELILNSKSLMYCRLFCKMFPKMDIRRFEDKVLKSKNKREIKLFANEVPSADRAQMMVVLF